MRVTDPNGTTWEVSRRLFRRPRFRGRMDIPDIGDIGPVDAGGGGFAALIAGIVLLVVLALVIVFVFPLILFAAELVLALALVGVKALLGRWTVVAETDRGRATWKVKGSRRSKELVAAVATALQTGAAVPAGGRFETMPSEVGLAEADVRDVERESNVRIVDR
jgi:hypothetical protein